MWTTNLKPFCGFLILAFLTLAPASAQISSGAGGDLPCVPRDLGFAADKAVWSAHPLSKLKRDTQYSLETQAGLTGHTALLAQADASASLFVSKLNPAAMLAPPPWLSWQWKAEALVPGADNKDKRREDAPLRVLLAFDGDVKKLPAKEQRRFKLAKALLGAAPPYAVLMYIWSEQWPVGTLIPSAHSSRVQMMVASSGSQELGHWQPMQRNLHEDYRRAFGEAPGALLALAVMTDTDNTGQKARGWYADLQLKCLP
ncbi:DUF3047 domain-containing protein [Roseateles sp.]|uniref:DUF3047 domain-containing protein n=1 Tax=Roseateles sp. TaxID=1971397 RepID=UPI003BA5AD2E